MTRLVCTASIVALALLFLTSTTPAAQDAQAKIKTASRPFLVPPDPSVTQAAVVNALLELLDVAVSLTRESEHAQDIKYRIDVAKDLMVKTSMFNEKARQYLSFAYRMTSGGKNRETEGTGRVRHRAGTGGEEPQVLRHARERRIGGARTRWQGRCRQAPAGTRAGDRDSGLRIALGMPWVEDGQIANVG